MAFALALSLSLSLSLEAADRTGPSLDAKLPERIAVDSDSGSPAEPLVHVWSYPGVRARWPADQSATLASLHDYDVAHGATLSTEPAHRYLTVVERSAGNDGLPLSEVAQVADSGPYPRGCALPHFAAHRAGDLKFFSQAAASASKPHHGQWNTRAFAMVVLRTKHN